MSPTEIQVREASDTERALITRLRRLVWSSLDPEREGAREAGGYYDIPDGAVELGAWAGETLLGAGRLTVHPTVGSLPHAVSWMDLEGTLPGGPIALMTRLVVAPTARGKGVSNALDSARIDTARRLGACAVLGFSHDLEGGHRRAALLRRGFQPIGEPRPDPLTTSLLLPVFLRLAPATAFKGFGEAR